MSVYTELDHYCPKCGCHYATHNDDGSCVVDGEPEGLDPDDERYLKAFPGGCEDYA